MRTLITIASTIIGTFLSIGLTELIIYMTDGKRPKYETMNFYHYHRRYLPSLQC